jgi:hypothetical protein
MSLTIAAVLIVPVLAAVACFLLPRSVSRVIVVLDAGWVGFNLCILGGCNPEGPVWMQEHWDPSLLWFVAAAAAPLLYEAIWKIRKLLRKKSRPV